MDRDEFLALYDQDQRYEVEYPDQRREVAGAVVRHVSRSSDGEGVILHTRLDECTVDAAVREQVAYFDGLGQPVEWKVFDYDRPLDLKGRLAAHGFEVGEEESVLVLELDSAPRWLFDPVKHTVRRILTVEHLEDVMAVEREVWKNELFGLQRYLAMILDHHPQRMGIYAAYSDGLPVSAAWIYFPANSRFASLWGGSTLEAHRRKGLYSALLAERAQEAAHRGVQVLTVDAGPMSRPILERLGFETVAQAYACRWRPES